MKNFLVQLLTVFVFVTCTVSAAELCHGQTRIVGMSIACSNDKVYTWYSDSTVSVGTSENLAAHVPPHPYTLPFGKTPENIVEVGISSSDQVYTWYDDSTVSVGTSTDLDKYQPRHPYKHARGKAAKDVYGIDIACKTDHVFTWYSLGLSEGTSEDLEYYSKNSDKPIKEYFPRPFDAKFENFGIAKNDHVYVWYKDDTASSGTTTNLTLYRPFYKFARGPNECDISVDLPTLSDGRVTSVGIRGPRCTSLTKVIVRLKTSEKRASGPLLAESRGAGGNFELPVIFKCRGLGKLTVFAEMEKAGRVVRSAETTIAKCF